MDIGKAVFAGFLMIAVAIVVVGYSGRGDAQSTTRALQISSGAANSAWAVDSTGKVLFCASPSTGNPGPICIAAQMKP